MSIQHQEIEKETIAAAFRMAATLSSVGKLLERSIQTGSGGAGMEALVALGMVNDAMAAWSKIQSKRHAHQSRAGESWSHSEGLDL